MTARHARPAGGPAVRRVARLRAHGATRTPLGDRDDGTVHMLWFFGLAMRDQLRRGAARASGSADRGPRYTLSAGDRSPVGCTLSFTRDARTVSPMPVAIRFAYLHPPGARSASVDRQVTGSVSPTASAPNGARVLRGKPLRLSVRCCEQRVLRRSRGGALDGPQGDDARLIDLARQGYPSELSLSRSAWVCQGGRARQ
jgi:hypothetical protein